MIYKFISCFSIILKTFYCCSNCFISHNLFFKIKMKLLSKQLLLRNKGTHTIQWGFKHLLFIYMLCIKEKKNHSVGPRHKKILSIFLWLFLLFMTAAHTLWQQSLSYLALQTLYFVFILLYLTSISNVKKQSKWHI